MHRGRHCIRVFGEIDHDMRKVCTQTSIISFKLSVGVALILSVFAWEHFANTEFCEMFPVNFRRFVRIPYSFRLGRRECVEFSILNEEKHYNIF